MIITKPPKPKSNFKPNPKTKTITEPTNPNPNNNPNCQKLHISKNKSTNAPSSTCRGGGEGKREGGEKIMHSISHYTRSNHPIQSNQIKSNQINQPIKQSINQSINKNRRPSHCHFLFRDEFLQQSHSDINHAHSMFLFTTITQSRIFVNSTFT